MRPTWRLVCHDTLASTNDSCIAQAQAGEPEGLVILARSQTRARGSRGRSWTEAKGSFAVSVLLRPRVKAPWPLIAGVVFHEALCPTPAHLEAIRLKWPNDVMLHGRKLGGILIESSGPPDGTNWLVIGFGANLAGAPELAERQAACLAELAPPPTADELAARLIQVLEWGETNQENSTRIRSEWLARAHPIGTPLAVRTAEGHMRGSFRSIAEDGTLLLAVGGDIRRISTGEILQLQGV